MLRALIDGSCESDFRLLIGYAGWGPGQLAREVSAGAWLPGAAYASLLFDGDVSTLWRRSYEKLIGTSPAAFVSTKRGTS